ncbi:MBL fold metallo-hydrolase [Haliovirga abyssi]|uniref:MBL fold metallo-hydrolase n=1 Tax=Haliovirga abyssi TaxID=2996794 RepID=A0AAU9D3X8_9FUSO|nr:MBL fold metallo-hydrolase [Haliovirga abyssi]BDU50681.1 MBL fold metallo-hydrolase [Haliovirga abyssi]
MAVFNIKFWGVRGSYVLSGNKGVKYGGNTTCIEVETDFGIIILDAGTGIIGLGKKIAAEKKHSDINILFTHTHKDHTEGFPSFLPAYFGNYKINLYGPKVLKDGIEEVISSSMAYSYFPVSYDEMGSLKNCTDINHTDVLILKKDSQKLKVYNKYHADFVSSENDVVVKILKGYNHPKNGVYIYRIEYLGKSFVFATDVESYIGGDAKLIQFAKDADVLVHDAAYDYKTYLKKQGWGHSTPEMAAENAKKAGVKKLFLTHHDPEDSEEDIEKKLEVAKNSFENSDLAIEGLEIDMLKNI